MKTDDRATRQRKDAKSDEAKVVRLSDWLAPDDELVPFGPRAHAHSRPSEPAEPHADPAAAAGPPAASGFWDGDTSVHTAVPAPGLFGGPGQRTAGRGAFWRRAPAWRPTLPLLDPLEWALRAGEWLADLVDRLSWRWAAVGAAVVALALIAVVVMLGGGSFGHHGTRAEAGIGAPSELALNARLGDIGTATRAAAASDLRRLPSVDDVAARTIGGATEQAERLQARHRRRAVVAPISRSSSSTTGSADTTSAPTETTVPTQTSPAPTESEPAQPASAPTTGGGSSSSGGGSSSDSKTQSTFGSAGSLGPGSSPNG